MTNPTETTVVVTPPTQQHVTVIYETPQNVITGSPIVVNTSATTTEKVEVQELGVVGQRGPAGRDGGAPEQYTVTAVPSFYQEHAYSYRPEVRLVNQSGETVWISAEYPDATHVSITFPTPFTGTIYLS